MAAATAEKESVMDESWETIDTAPREETVILGYAPNSGLVIALYHEKRREWVNVYGMGSVTLTHWMHVPQPPEQYRVPASTVGEERIMGLSGH